MCSYLVGLFWALTVCVYRINIISTAVTLSYYVVRVLNRDLLLYLQHFSGKIMQIHNGYMVHIISVFHG